MKTYTYKGVNRYSCTKRVSNTTYFLHTYVYPIGIMAFFGYVAVQFVCSIL